jgi:valyl-tRNA synthetase
LRNLDWGQAAENLYEFFWHVFCDKYLEKVKNRLYADKPDSEALGTLFTVLETSLILLHPFMPFITEIWQKLPNRKSLLINASWPKK